MKRKLMIAFVGIDGSGKTSIIEGVKKKLEKDGERVDIVYMGLGSSHYFKPLKWIMKARSSGRKKRSGGDAKVLRKQNYRYRNFSWVLGQFSELWLRYRDAKKRSRKKIILFDRYFYDGLILARDKTCKFMSPLVPKPDISFIVTGDPKTIWKRKKEADVEDIEMYYRNAKRIKKYFGIKEIRNDKSLKKAIDEVYSVILKKL